MARLNRLCVRSLFWTALLLIGGLSASVNAQGTKPITKEALIQALKIGGLSSKELIGIIQKRGVDFAVDPIVEAELHKAGAGQEVLRPGTAERPGGAPP